MKGDLARIRAVIKAARRRWFWHTLLGSAARAAAATTVVALLAWLVVRFGQPRSPLALAFTAAAIAIALGSALGWALWPLRRRPSDQQVARFVEERCPQLEDRLASAVDASVGSGSSPTMLTQLLYRDAALRVGQLDLDQTISRRTIRRDAWSAGGSVALLAVVLLAVVPSLGPAIDRVRALLPRSGETKLARRPAKSATAPRVTSIDVHYEYPAALRLAPRTEENSGDVYAPPGTMVELRIHTDRPVRSGSLTLSSSAPVGLAVTSDRLFGATLTVRADGSYRVTLTGTDGVESPGDTEYFIKVLNDAPPDVRIVAPAADRQVTPLDEVTIAAHAEDDHGVKNFDLVYSVRGGPETAVPFTGDRRGTSFDGKRVLYLEDLHVRPGDFVTYYARARDGAVGEAATEARSDLFFLEVTPFDPEFLPPLTQAAASGTGVGTTQTLDDLVRAQKEIVIATWKLDRRARKNRSGGSEDDVRTVARAQGDLRKRAAEAAGPAFARASQPDSGKGAPDGNEPMATAIDAMGEAERALDAASTSAALPHETRALNELMKAQASQRRWQMQRAAGAGAGTDSGNSSQDLTSLFDHELKREAQTNYEMPRTSARADDPQPSDALERVRRMAERQGDLSRQQEELERQRQAMNADEFTRNLERLTREQSELRQQVEELAQHTQSGANGQGRSRAEGSQSTGTQAAANRPRGRDGTLGDASDAMRRAASSLREGRLGDASRQSGQALAKLQSAERELRTSQPGRGAPALGDLQLEAQQLADVQRRMASEWPSGPEARDALRRMAGEKERLADRLDRLQQGVKSAAENQALEGRERQVVAGIARDFDRLQLGKQARESAAALRVPERSDVNRPESASKERNLANTLDRLADRLSAAAGRGTERASGQLDRTREIHDRLAQLGQQLRDLEREGAGSGESSSASAQGSRSAAKASERDGGPVGTSGGDGGNREAALRQLREEYVRELRRGVDQLKRLGSEGSAVGFTPEGQEAILSAPGFHQDFSKWEQLARGVNTGLERAETLLTKKLREQQARDRLKAPGGEQPPEAYRRLVEQYYQSLAGKGR